MSVLGYLRTRSLRDGFWRGRRAWTAIGVVVWGGRLLRRLVRPESRVVAVEKIEPGQQLCVSVEPNRKRRR